MPTLSDVATLTELLEHARETFPQTPLSFIDSDGEERTRTISSFAESTSRVASGFAGAGVSPGQPVLIVSLDPDLFVLAFWGALLLGAKPVPMAPEPERIRHVWAMLEKPPIATTHELMAQPEVLVGDASASLTLELLSIEDALNAPVLETWHEAGPQDVAFLQFSSGSTGRPRGIMLTHHNVVENVRQMVARLDASSKDVLVNWMPFYHDMGLIGGHIAPMAVGAAQVKLHAGDVARDPAGWWRITHRYAASILLAANMALAASARRVGAEALQELEFSSVRAMVVGAEHISWRVIKDFFDRFVPRGLSPDAVVPAYGLAEATLAVTMTAPGEGVTVYQLDREEMAISRRAELTGDPSAARFIDLGAPVDGVEVRVVDDEGQALEDGQVGELQVRGDNVARGYWGEPGASAEVFADDGWLRTGDVGVLLEGRVCITGRERELVILDGQHYFASDLEGVVREVSGWDEGRALVVGVIDESIGAERVVCFVTQRGDSIESMLPELHSSRAALREAVGLPDVTMMILPGDDFPRTTSGKLRRVTLQHRWTLGDYERLARDLDAALDAFVPGAHELTPDAPDADAGSEADLDAAQPGVAEELEQAPPSIASWLGDDEEDAPEPEVEDDAALAAQAAEDVAEQGDEPAPPSIEQWLSGGDASSEQPLPEEPEPEPPVDAHEPSGEQAISSTELEDELRAAEQLDEHDEIYRDDLAGLVSNLLESEAHSDSEAEEDAPEQVHVSSDELDDGLAEELEQAPPSIESWLGDDEEAAPEVEVEEDVSQDEASVEGVEEQDDAPAPPSIEQWLSGGDASSEQPLPEEPEPELEAGSVPESLGGELDAKQPPQARVLGEEDATPVLGLPTVQLDGLDLSEDMREESEEFDAISDIVAASEETAPAAQQLAGEPTRALSEDELEAEAERSVAMHDEDEDAAPGALDADEDTTPIPQTGVASAMARHAWGTALGRPPEEVPEDVPFASLGGTQEDAARVLARLEQSMDRRLDARLMEDLPTLEAFISRLEDAVASEVTTAKRSAPVGLTPALEASREPSGDAGFVPVNVLAMACRFPGVETPEALWSLVAEGKNVIGAAPKTRLDQDLELASNPDAQLAPGGYLEDIAGVDALALGLTDAEARWLDPHARLFSELVEELVERADQVRPVLTGQRRVGVFVGAGAHGWTSWLERAVRGSHPLEPEAYAATATHALAARVAERHGFTGPTVVVDGGGISSHQAIVMACEAIGRGECDMAIVGGVFVDVGAWTQRLLTAAGQLSLTGAMRSLGSNPGGMTLGEGAGAMLLMRSGRASERHILGRIVGASMRQRHGESRSHAMRAALVGLDPQSVTYIDAHADGLHQHDVGEYVALSEAYGAPTSSRWLGSIKANLGHTMHAAGIASAIKVVQSALFGQIAPHPNHHSLHPGIDGAGWEVTRSKIAWEGSRRAAITGIGDAGQVAHVVFEAPAAQPPAPWRPPPQALLATSAADEESLRQRLAQCASLLGEPYAGSPVHVATMTTRARGARPWRAATVLTADPEAASARLEDFVERGETQDMHVFVAARAPQTAWMFPGESVHRAGVLLRLASRFPSFAARLARASELFGEVEGRGLATWLGDDVQPVLLEQAAVSIPLVVTAEVALAQWLMDKGWEPDYVVGHGVGELAAAYVAGAFDDEQTITRAKILGAMVQRAPGGALAAVRTRRESVDKIIAEMGLEVSVAAVNAPNELALAGDPDALDAICDHLGKRGVPVARVDVSHAMHTPFMEDVREQILMQPAAWVSNPVRIPISLSALDWVVAPGEVIEPDYWGQQIADSVDFQRAMTPIASMVDVLVEVGLSRALTSYARRHPLGHQTEGYVLLGEGGDEIESALDVLGAMWARGLDVSLEVAAGDPGVRVPTYPFQRQARWIAQPKLEEVRAPSLPPVANHPVVRRCLELKMDTARFTLELEVDDPLVSERSVHGVRMLPLASVLESAIAAVQRAHRDTPWGLARVSVSRPVLARGDGAHAHVQLERDERFTFHVLTEQDEPAVMGQILMDPPSRARSVPIEAVRARATTELTDAQLDALLTERGVSLGEYFQCVHDVRVGTREAIASLRGPREPRFDAFVFHPAMIDAALHLATVIASIEQPGRRIALEPIAVDKLVVRGLMPRECVVHVTMDPARDGDVSTLDVVVTTPDGRPVVELHRVSARPIDASSLANAPVPLFTSTWEELAAPGSDAELAVVRAPRGELQLAEATERLTGELEQADGDVLVITRGAFAEDEELDPAHTALATLALGWGLEQTERNSVVLDVGPGVGESELALAISRRPAGALLRWQDGRFLRRRSHPLAAPDAWPADWEPGLRAVISDASGSAADLARDLAKQWGAHIVLVGRNPLDEDEAQVKLMRELELLGAASRTYVEANLQSAVGRAMAVAGIREAIDGVDLFVHGLGDLGVRRLDASDFALHRDACLRRVAASLMVGALDASDLGPARVVILSSMLGQDVQASPGFVMRAAGDAYLEAWCTERRASGLSATHIAMPLVQDAIDADEEHARVLATRGITAVTAAQSAAAVLAAIATGAPSVIVGHAPGELTGRAPGESD